MRDIIYSMIINEMAIFYTVVQQSSFSKAAAQLGVSKSFISKHITQLEKQLKIRLLNRTTRQLSLTEAGEIFYQHCQIASTVANDAHNAIINLQTNPSGILKIAVPPALATHLLADTMIEYMQLYPDVKLNVNLDSQFVDIVKEGFDLALRIAAMPDSSLICQKITSLGAVICASPQYLKKYGPIKYPEELSQHLFASYIKHRLSKTLIFTYKNTQHTINVSSNFECNSLDLMVKIPNSNSCLAVLPTFMAKKLVQKKKIVICLPEYKLPTVNLYAVYSERSLLPLKVKAFIDMLKSNLAD